MNNGSQFDGVGLAPGVVVGARSFEIDKMGRLIGIHYKQVWNPRENSAECRKQEVDSSATYPGFGLSYSFMEEYLYGKKRKPTKVEPEQPKKHTMASCACGFYGYYDGSNDYHGKGRVSGVIEGYGETLIGTRGFRCSRARIIALSINGKVEDRLAGLIRRNYSGIPMFDSFKSMVAEFPADGGELAVSPTSDPQFWTRKL